MEAAAQAPPTADTILAPAQSPSPAPSVSQASLSPSESSASPSQPPPPPPVAKNPTRVFAQHPPSWTRPPSSRSRDLALEVFKDEGAVIDTIRCGAKPAHTFGRNTEQCTHTLDHSSISRQHAAIMHNNDGAWLVDLHSSQGTAVNGTKVKAGEPHFLRNGDVIQFGQSSRKYRVKGLGASGEKRARDDPSASDSSSKRARNGSGKPEIRASHILIKHAGSRRPSSHNQATITRTQDEAAQQLETIQQQLAQYASLPLSELREHFGRVAKEVSDCSSYKRGGDLGHFSADRMQPAFSEAAFRLTVGEMSAILATDSGVHLILRTE